MVKVALLDFTLNEKSEDPESVSFPKLYLLFLRASSINLETVHFSKSKSAVERIIFVLGNYLLLGTYFGHLSDVASKCLDIIETPH